MNSLLEDNVREWFVSCYQSIQMKFHNEVNALKTPEEKGKAYTAIGSTLEGIDTRIALLTQHHKRLPHLPPVFFEHPTERSMNKADKPLLTNNTIIQTLASSRYIMMLITPLLDNFMDDAKNVIENDLFKIPDSSVITTPIGISMKLIRRIMHAKEWRVMKPGDEDDSIIEKQCTVANIEFMLEFCILLSCLRGFANNQIYYPRFTQSDKARKSNMIYLSDFIEGKNTDMEAVSLIMETRFFKHNFSNIPIFLYMDVESNQYPKELNLPFISFFNHLIGKYTYLGQLSHGMGFYELTSVCSVDVPVAPDAKT